MDITLVTSSYDKVVHGTENEKKTGCGINLLKPENVTRFHRTSMMTDLKEITCEKCKASLAKKIIKADKKEMALLLREEKKREKLGMNDAGIVPLGNTTARITRDPDAKRKEEEARRKAAEEARKAAEEARKAAEEARKAAEEAAAAEAEQNNYGYQDAPEPEVPKNTIPGTGVAIDDSLAQFAINVPHEEEPAPVPAAEDDFLAQFAIQKPDAEVAQSNTAVKPEDDFLAQFAIPSPNSTVPVQETVPAYYNEEPDEMDGLDFSAKNPPAYGQPELGTQPQNGEDIMQMFSIDNAPEEPAYGQQPYGGQIYGQQPYGEPVYDQQPYGGQKLYDANGQEIVPDGVLYDSNGQEIPQNGQWDYVANQLFGFEGVEQPIADEPVPAYPVYDENMPKEMDELDIPAIQDIEVPVFDALPSAESVSAPILDDIVEAEDIAAPVLDEIPTVEDMAAPVLDEIPTVEDIAAPVLDEIPTVEDIAAPVLDEIPTVEDIAAPVLDEITTVEDIAAPVLDEIPTVEDIAAPVLDEIPAVEDIAAPVLDEIPAAEEITAPVLDNIPSFEDVAAPVLEDLEGNTFNQPIMAEEEFDTDMSDYNYVAPGRSAETNTENTEQTNQAAPQQAAAQQPQVIKVPQLAGYDANNQPVYKYIQMKLAGYDQKGQPVYVPLQAAPQGAAKPQQAAAPRPQAAAAPAQQTAAQAQRAAAAPAQPAAVNSPVPKKPVQQQGGVPKANISQIAVNPHSKSTSKAFIDAISVSKEYADKNLIETQGLKANSPILTSVEDVLSTMGDETIKRQQAAKTQQAVPVFEEYKAPTGGNRGGYRNNSAPRPMQSMEKDVRYMTKSELKAKKKQDKIEAKFKKEMSKRGF